MPAFLRDAAGRYVALDGRTWRTLRDLLFRPGFLTREYFAGRRRRYVRPGRLFLVLSLAMFTAFRMFAYLPAPAMEMSGADRPGTNEVLQWDTGAPPAWLAPYVARANAFAQLPRAEQSERIESGIFRYGPYAAIALLPVFALLLKAVYLWGGARYPGRPRRYAAHLVFSAHYHAFLFLIGLLYAVAPGPLRTALGIWAGLYGLWAMKTVYGGRWSGVILRGVQIALVYLLFFVVALAALVVTAVALR